MTPMKHTQPTNRFANPFESRLKNFSRIATAAAAAALLGACASTSSPAASTDSAGAARPAGGHGHAAFLGGYDTNRDGVVTRTEYDTVRKARYVAADTNQDGWLSEAEYVAEFEGRLQQQLKSEGRQPDKAYENSMKQAHVRFSLLDRDRDGRLTVDEELAIAEKTFKGADTNGDGVVSDADVKKP